MKSIAERPSLADPKRRLIGLDVLRFVAVILVLHVHATLGFGLFQSKEVAGTLARILGLVIPPGAHGVDIFFVLSGFLVSGLLFTELAHTGTISGGRFLIRRGFKIYPPFWLLILATVTIQYYQSGRINREGLFAELVFVQNYLPGLWGHTWSLAVEEHFYLILIGIFLAMKQFAGPNGRLNLKLIPRAFDVVVLFCLAAKVLTWWLSVGYTNENQRWFVWVTHVRIDALFFGMLLAHWWYNRWSDAFKARLLSFRLLWVVVGVLLISPVSLQLLNVESWYIFGFILVYLGAGCLLIAALSLDHFRCPDWFRWIAWLGKHSYSVYLWHMLVLDWLRPLLGTKSSGTVFCLTKELIYVASSWIFGILMARIIEFPMLRLRDRLFPARVANVKPT